MGSSGWKTASLTEPVWPGNLYSSFLVATSHMNTILSALPHVTCSHTPSVMGGPIHHQHQAKTSTICRLQLAGLCHTCHFSAR